tara:strand:+ start:28 stop:396 length:369 start_codon:yes stop_codon:yes gene_type:complete
MKKLLALLFSILVSFNSYGEWKEYSIGGYVETSSIKLHNDYVYYWRMDDYGEPDKWGDMSSQAYSQGDCNLNRIKTLSYVFYKEGMGQGLSEQEESVVKDWKYPAPGTYSSQALNYVCNYVD